MTKLQHPLLLERHLAPLPRTPAVDAEDIVSAFGEQPSNSNADEDAPAPSHSASRHEVSDIVVPIDFIVDDSVRCVAITGPNTGGKTASLKAMGVACLMARAGMYVPCEPGCEIPFFRDVVVDLGDSQTLQLDGGLSTFGAHLKSLQRILDAANEETLVLLDEPGSGTDPAEGAALAVAVLNKLSRESRLTVATSHYENVKENALASPVAQVAAVEFDMGTLQPTYRLLWGETGQSNALHIAAGLGLSPSIIAEAREALAKSDASTETDANGAIAREKRAQLASALDKECEVQLARRLEASYGLKEARALYDEVMSESAYLDLRKQIMKADADAAVESTLGEARELFAACATVQEVDEVTRGHLPRGWTLGANGDAVPEDAADGASAQWFPSVGELVIVRKLGTTEAEVIDVFPETNEITVKLGRISTRVSLASGVSKVDVSKKNWR
ncbi:mismatch repair ATPase MSH4 [Ostreococcus tauri]|uniref:Mismatch repair ATPase MSH4 n=1 Tax=Ostreococcus tauri TaxID=70448 RepID=A0A1Y5I565_OSTTA|nr:mismatch repair ATPase MSH4 [Ostreococcus tauri]